MATAEIIAQEARCPTEAQSLQTVVLNGDPFVITISQKDVRLKTPVDAAAAHLIFRRETPKEYLPLQTLNNMLNEAGFKEGLLPERLKALTETLRPAVQIAGPEWAPHVWTDFTIQTDGVSPAAQVPERDQKPTPISEEVIRRAQAGNHGAFEMIFNRYQTQIYNYIYRFMASAEDAFDMTQDTFLKAYLALPKTSDDLHLRLAPWLYRIATNVALDELRHRKLVKWQPWEAFISVFHPSQVAKDCPERDCIDMENTEEVQLILDRLHPRHRMCLILREYHDLSYDEIAEVLDTTCAAVKSLLYRAREEFRQVYAKTERQPMGNLVPTKDGKREYHPRKGIPLRRMNQEAED